MDLSQLPMDHVAIAVSSIEEARPIYEALTNATGSRAERLATEGVRVMFIGDGTGRIELLEPTTPDSPVGRFLGRNGPGLHHIAYRVSDLERTIERLKGLDIHAVDPHPRQGAHGTRVAFLHPKTTRGVLIELVEAR